MKRLALAAVLLLSVTGCGQAAARATHCPGLSIAGTHIGADDFVTASLTAALPDGALVLGSSQVRRGNLTVTLQRMAPDCSVSSMAPVTLHVGRYGAGINAMVATADGRLLIAGGDARHALVGRLLPSGKLDPTFGRRGWTLLTPREKSVSGMPPPAFAATSIAVAPSGTIVVGGNDGGAHCCVRDFVSTLTPNGAVTFTRPVPFGGSYTTQVSPNRDGSIYALGEYEQSGCGGPSIVRIRPDGSLDKRFDLQIFSTVRRIESGGNLRFTPTLVPGPGGTFALVGGLDKTCVPAAATSTGASRGVSVRVSASGKMAGRPAFFASPGYAFDSPTTLGLRNGVVLAAALAYTEKGKPRAVLVHDRAGVRRIPVRGHAGESYGLVSLLPASDDTAWLVIGFPDGIDVSRIDAA